MGVASVEVRSAIPGNFRSRRLLALAADERLVEQVRRGNEAAFDILFERYAPALLAFSRHMLRSREEAEDAVQLTFAAAYRALLREPDRAVVLKPWLFTIARNRCFSMLRARREQPGALVDLPSDGLAHQVEERAELRQLLADVRELPEEQRSALLLAEVSDLSHAQVADVLGCEVARVKALVFQARTGLINRRRARETPCAEIQEQLVNLGGSSLRRTPVRLHLRECAACRAYREEVRRQRRMLAAALPVTPTPALKASVLSAVGLGGGSAGGGIAAGVSSLAGALGGGALVKIAVVGAVAGGSVIAAPAIVDSGRKAHIPAAAPPSENGPAGSSTSMLRGGPPRGFEPSRRPRRFHHGRAEAPGRPHSPVNGVAPEKGERTSKGATPPGQARRAVDKPTPPGQAKKSARVALPPGQSKPRHEKTVPPGQTKGSATGGKVKTPTQPSPKAKNNPKPENNAPAAPPPATNPVPAAPPAPSPGPKPKEKSKP
jgi:RNA polymerase sigma factor (sigma-70 family)